MSTVDSAWCVSDEYCTGCTLITSLVNNDYVDGICRLFNVYLHITDAGVWKAGQANAVKRKWCQLCRHFRSVSRSILWAVVCFCQLPLFWLTDWFQTGYVDIRSSAYCLVATHSVLPIFCSVTNLQSLCTQALLNCFQFCGIISPLAHVISAFFHHEFETPYSFSTFTCHLKTSCS